MKDELSRFRTIQLENVGTFFNVGTLYLAVKIQQKYEVCRTGRNQKIQLSYSYNARSSSRKFKFRPFGYVLCRESLWKALFNKRGE